jgi:hypothetical protein
MLSKITPPRAQISIFISRAHRERKLSTLRAQTEHTSQVGWAFHVEIMVIALVLLRRRAGW